MDATLDSGSTTSPQPPTGGPLCRSPLRARSSRHLRRSATLVLALLTLAIAVAPASAATSDQIVRDVRDGHVDGVYSQADLNAALSSPLLKTYGGGNGVEAVKEALGAQTVGAAGSGQLPFTGFELVTFVVLGSALLVAGFVLRRQPRPEHVHGD